MFPPHHSHSHYPSDTILPILDVRAPCLRNAFFAHLDLLLIVHIDTFTLFIHDFTMYMLDDYVYLLYYLLDIITHYVIGTSILWPAYLSDNTCTLVYGKIPFVLCGKEMTCMIQSRTVGYRYSKGPRAFMKLYETVIFFGACSGDVLGKDTVRTPFSIEALISSGYKAMVSIFNVHQKETQRIP